MILQGKLSLSYGNDDYIMFSNGRNENISDILYSMYMDKSIVKAKITNAYNGKVLFDAKGELWKDRIQPKYYTYCIGEHNIDEVLWNNVGRILEIDVKNITKEKEK